MLPATRQSKEAKSTYRHYDISHSNVKILSCQYQIDGDAQKPEPYNKASYSWPCQNNNTGYDL
jgi:hypothetical protein